MTAQFGIIYKGCNQKDCFRLLDEAGFSHELDGFFVSAFKDIAGLKKLVCHDNEFEVFILCEGTTHEINFKSFLEKPFCIETNAVPKPYEYFNMLSHDEDRAVAFFNYLAQLITGLIVQHNVKLTTKSVEFPYLH